MIGLYAKTHSKIASSEAQRGVLAVIYGLCQRFKLLHSLLIL